MTLDGRILRGLFEHERLKPTAHKNESRKHSELNSIKTSY